MAALLSELSSVRRAHTSSLCVEASLAHAARNEWLDTNAIGTVAQLADVLDVHVQPLVAGVDVFMHATDTTAANMRTHCDTICTVCMHKDIL